jgi:hypothetical protein
LPVIGIDGIIRRGTKPSEFVIRVPHDANLNLVAGNLELYSDDGGYVTLANSIPDLSTIWTEFRGGRREFVISIRDRRQAWAGASISGRYNRRYRDNSIAGATKKRAGEIAGLCLAAAGEPSGSAPDLGNVYPECDWASESVTKALDQVLSYVPSQVCRTKTDSYEIIRTDEGDDINDSWPLTAPNYLADIDSGPKTLKAICGKSWFGCKLELEAVGLDTDGNYKLWDDLSYTPAGGWAAEWPTLFSGVNPGYRSWLALNTVGRCYRVKVPQTLPFTDGNGNTIVLTSRESIDLDPYRLMFGEQDPAPCYVNGTFWPYTDHPYNTENCPVVACDFELDNVNKLVRFAQPIFKFDSCIAAADLYLHTSFHIRGADGTWVRDTFERDRGDGQGEWRLELPFLWRAAAQAYVDCGVSGNSDNQATLQAEAEAYLDLWEAHFNAVKDKRDVTVPGIHPVSLSGKIAMLQYRVGRGLPPKTRILRNYEATR